MPSRQQVIDRLGLDGIEVLSLGALSSEADRLHRIVSARLGDAIGAVDAGGGLQLRASSQYSAPHALVRLREFGGEHLTEALVPLTAGSGRDQVRWLVDGARADGAPADVAGLYEQALRRTDALVGSDLVGTIAALERARRARALVWATKTLRMDLRKTMMAAVDVEAGMQRLTGNSTRAATIEALREDWAGDREQLLRTVATLADDDGPQVCFPALVDEEHRGLLVELSALDDPGPDASRVIRRTLDEHEAAARAALDVVVGGLGVANPVCQVDRGYLRVGDGTTTLVRLGITALLDGDEPRPADDEMARQLSGALQGHHEHLQVLVLAERVDRLQAMVRQTAGTAQTCRADHAQLAALGGTGGC